MKKIMKKCCIGILLFIIMQALLGTVLAESAPSVPFAYNVLPTIARESIIDNQANPMMNFRLYEPVEAIYYQGKLVTVIDGVFSIDVSDLKGKCVITFTNQDNEKAMFQYYFPDEQGFVKDYELVKGEKLNVYVETHRNVKIIYTDKEQNAMTKAKEYLDELPENFLVNLKMIKMIPFDNTQNIAGSTKNETITLYRFSKYSKQTKKQILFHEIAHTFANKLMEKRVIDYSYTNYTEAAKKDKNFVSNYAKDFANINNRLSEDFADSVAEYLMSSSFATRYPHRAEYIKSLLENQ